MTNMKKETQKEKIERLEQENKKLREELQKSWDRESEQDKVIYTLKNEQDSNFKKSALYEEMEQKIRFLENEIAMKDKRMTRLQEKFIHTHNERGAGRKPRLSPAEEEEIVVMHLNGESMRRIAQHMGCSVGLVHKLINEHKNMGSKRNS